MYGEEEKIRYGLKITFFLLITLLGVALFEENMMMVLLLFYIAFIKD
tara:strand:+ start:523 stop:663 length:141 start_codon:yes stop_codon:yes gene_type:complete